MGFPFNSGCLERYREVVQSRVVVLLQEAASPSRSLGTPRDGLHRRLGRMKSLLSQRYESCGISASNDRKRNAALLLLKLVCCSVFQIISLLRKQ
jgi:hypothetical protein